MTVFKWVLSATLALLGLLALFLHRTIGGRSLGRVTADAIDASSKPKIAVLTDRIKTLETDVEANADAIGHTKAKIEAIRADVTAVYSVVGLSANEVVTRLNKLKL